MFTHWITAPKRTASRAQLQLEALESRWAPAHLVTELPAPAFNGAHGIERHNNGPGLEHCHRRFIFIFTD